MSQRLALVRYAAQQSAKEPLVFLHGLFGSASNFRTLARPFAHDRDVLLPELPNHGASHHTPGPTSLEAMARDLLATLDAERVECAVLCGHSLGGKVVAAAALLAPERVSRLCVVDIAPVAYDTSSERSGWAQNVQILKAMRALPPHMLHSRATASEALAPSVPDETVRAFLLQNLVPNEARWRINVDSILESMPHFASFPHLHPAPQRLPALFIGGERSAYLAPSLHEATANLFPGARFVTFPNTGHWVHAEAPGLFSKTLAEFLDEPR